MKWWANILAWELDTNWASLADLVVINVGGLIPLEAVLWWLWALWNWAVLFLADWASQTLLTLVVKVSVNSLLAVAWKRWALYDWALDFTFWATWALLAIDCNKGFLE